MLVSLLDKNVCFSALSFTLKYVKVLIVSALKPRQWLKVTKRIQSSDSPADGEDLGHMHPFLWIAVLSCHYNAIAHLTVSLTAELFLKTMGVLSFAVPRERLYMYRLVKPPIVTSTRAPSLGLHRNSHQLIPTLPTALHNCKYQAGGFTPHRFFRPYIFSNFSRAPISSEQPSHTSI